MNWMRKRLRQLGWLLGSLAILLAVCVGVENVRGRHALNKRLGELKARGEKLTVLELEPPHPPAELNAALALLALTNEIRQLHSNLFGLPPAGRFAAPGRMMTVWQFEAWSEDKKTNTWRHSIQMMGESKSILQAIHAALQKPEWDGGFDYKKGFCDFQAPPLVHIKTACRLLTTAVACDLRQGSTSSAIERLADAIRLVRLQTDERLIISQLVRIACAALAWNSSWEILQTNAWNDVQLAILQAAWQDMDFSIDMTRALEMERGMTLDLFKFMTSSSARSSSQIAQREAAEAMLGGEYSFLPTHGAILHWVHLPFWRMAWAQQDARRALDRWQELVETDRIVRNGSWAAAKDRAGTLDLAAAESPWVQTQDEEPKKSIYDRWRYLVSNQTFGVGGGVLRRVVETETARRMMVTALALKRHHLRVGQPAARLDVLVPELLPGVPLDGMDGKPLRYRLNPDGTFLLYSVGEDGKDDGGDSNLPKSKAKFTQMWDGNDAVWPATATQEEATKAAWRK